MNAIHGFREIAGSAPDNAQVGLRQDHGGTVVRRGRLSRWIGHMRKSGNRAVSTRFLQSLRSRYGRELADHMLVSTGLDRVLASGKPLRARHVRLALMHADSLQDSVRARNEQLAQSFRRGLGDGSSRSMLDIQIDQALEHGLTRDPAVAGLLDRPELSRRVEQALIHAGRDGKRLVTNDLAAVVVRDIVHQEFDRASDRAREQALDRLDLAHAQAIGQTALRAAAESHEPPLQVDPDRLSSDARAELARRLGDALQVHDSPAQLLADEARLGQLARDVMADFLQERAAAQTAVASLPELDVVSAAETDALLQQVLHDNVPAAHAPSMARAYVACSEQVARLATPMSPAELEQGVKALRDATAHVFADAGLHLDAATRDPVHRTLWRCLLAPGGPSQQAAIAERLKPAASPLRAIGEGAMWYQTIFPASDEANKSFVSVLTDTVTEEVYPEQSFSTATGYATMLATLAEVLREREPADTACFLEPNANVPDQTIATLRNLGVPMPAPDRLGAENSDVPISASGLAAVRQELADHLSSKAGGPVNEHGVYQESARDFIRATYKLEGTQIAPNEGAVTRALRDLCTNANGQPDPNMLKSVSLMAYQAGTGCALAAVCDPARRDLAIFNGFPRVNQREQYSLWKDSTGDVMLECRQSGPILGLDRQSLDGVVDPVATDPAKSHLNLTVKFRISADTYEPQLEDLRVSYALARLAEPSRGGSGADVG